MKQARYKEPLPLAVIEAARAGDAGAVEQVLQYYNGYINKLCTRTLYDDCGQLHVCVDEYMKHRLDRQLLSFWRNRCYASRKKNEYSDRNKHPFRKF